MNLDEMGLEPYYDLVVLGTGLPESILSCAASKAGLKVLHLDRNDFYGENYCAFNLQSLLGVDASSDSERTSQDADPAFGRPTIKTSTISLEQPPGPEYIVAGTLTASNLANPCFGRRSNGSSRHPATIGYVMEKEVSSLGASGSRSVLGDISYPAEAQQTTLERTIPKDSRDDRSHPVFAGYVKSTAPTVASLLHDSNRSFNIDLTAKSMYCSGPFIDALLTSGVCKYLEFQSIDGIYLMLQATGKPNDDPLFDMWKVPCSKGDIFNSNHLNALEKRSLMKFLRYVFDWGAENLAGKEVYSMNDIELAQGRSLHRPQNKRLEVFGPLTDQENKLTGAAGESSVSTAAMVIDNVPFRDLLKDHKLSSKLQEIIIYALCFHPFDDRGRDHSNEQSTLTSQDALRRLYLHVNSLGRYGTSAFLSPIYGSGEIVQAYCRMSAVWGGTFILRHSIASIDLLADAVEQATAVEEIEKVRCEAAKKKKEKNLSSIADGECEEEDPLREDQLAEEPTAPPSPRMRLTDSTGRTIFCRSFVCNAVYWPDQLRKYGRKELLMTAIAVCDGSVLPVERATAILPPFSHGVDNTRSVFIQQTDSSTSSVPQGLVVLHVSTTIPVSVSVGAETSFCDATEAVRDSCWDWKSCAREKYSEVAMDVSTKVMRLLHQTAKKEKSEDKQGGDCPQPFREICRSVFLRPIFDTASLQDVPSCVEVLSDCNGLSLDMQLSIAQAKESFFRLFPADTPFLADEEAAELAKKREARDANHGAEEQEDSSVTEEIDTAFLQTEEAAAETVPGSVPASTGEGQRSAAASTVESEHDREEAEYFESILAAALESNL